MKHPPVTEDSILKALKRASKVLKKDPAVLSTEQAAGFILHDDKFEGVQVFIKVARYSETLLKEQPLSGGLFALAK